jgi:chondroitin AC lyase
MGSSSTILPFRAALTLLLLLSACMSGALCQINQVRTQMLQLLQVRGSVVDTNITGWLSALQADGSFADINYTDPNIAWWPACYHTRRMWTISAAHASPSSMYYNSSESLQAGLATFDFWLRNDFQNANWWYNDIGVPQAVGPTMLLLQPYALPNQTAAALTILSRASADGGTDANAVWEEAVQCYTAVITENATALAHSTSLLWSAISLQSSWNPSETGIKPDKSFWMHGSQFYSGGYGHMYAASLLTAVAWAAGTTFQPSSAAIQLLVDFLVDGSLQMIRYNDAAPAEFGIAMWDVSTIGREISRPYGMDWNSGAGQTVSFQGAALEAIAESAAYRVNDLRQFAALLNGTSASPALGVNTGFRYYPFSAYAVFNSPSYLLTVRMASNVTQTIERYVSMPPTFILLVC